MNSMRAIGVLAGLFGVAAAAPGGDANGTGYVWQQSDTSLALTRGGKVVWKHNHDRTEPMPYVHPLALSDGTVLTNSKPADHKWHYGLWFSWTVVNGANYWYADPKLPHGKTEIGSVKASPEKDFSAGIRLELAYSTAKDANVMREQRLIAVSAPDANGGYHMDWTMAFTAGANDVVLANNYYGGMSARMAAELRPQKEKGWHFADSAGRKDGAIMKQKARWAAYSGLTASGKPAVVAILVHKDNPRGADEPWCVIPNMPYFNPAFTGAEKYTIPAGKSLALRYRVLVCEGAMDTQALDNRWMAYAGAKEIAAPETPKKASR